MKTIGAFEAKTHLSDLLTRVGKGESFVITKRGKPVAALGPVVAGGQPSPKELIDEFRRRRPKSFKGLTIDEIIAFKNYGRK